jgi:cyanuric acid amidohydrolase
MANPGDVSELRKLIAGKVIDPAEVVASIGKTEGNGGANDFTRALATQSVADLLAAELGITREEAAARAALAWSGGCEGVLSPHITVFTRADASGEDGITGGLAISVQRTRHFLPEEVGRTAEVTEVAAAVTRALEELQVAADEVHYVQVKGPLLTPRGHRGRGGARQGSGHHRPEQVQGLRPRGDRARRCRRSRRGHGGPSRGRRHRHRHGPVLRRGEHLGGRGTDRL